MEKPITYIGLDVHKATIAVALAEAGKRGEVREYGTRICQNSRQGHPGWRAGAGLDRGSVRARARSARIGELGQAWIGS